MISSNQPTRILVWLLHERARIRVFEGAIWLVPRIPELKPLSPALPWFRSSATSRRGWVCVDPVVALLHPVVIGGRGSQKLSCRPRPTDNHRCRPITNGVKISFHQRAHAEDGSPDTGYHNSTRGRIITGHPFTKLNAVHGRSSRKMKKLFGHVHRTSHSSSLSGTSRLATAD